ncbi:MAG: hypothetical protein FWH37_07195 [Candidatus Bathyarchaeota archaeon]|nr:hypothetical protein [Candidatus Termiticorpusculum sp.]
MKVCKKYSNKLLSIFLVLVVFLLMYVVPVSFGATISERQVKVPLFVDLSSAIAGAEFAFEYSSGLEFVSYEKSGTVFSAVTTPIVVKNGQTYLGFYNVDNRYAPTNGKLDMGYLIFNCSDDASQYVTLTEIKLVRVVDNDTTRSEFLAPVEIKISPENNTVDSSVTDTDNTTSSTGTKDSSINSNDGNTSLPGVKDSSVNDNDDSVSSTGTKDTIVDISKGSGVPHGFWVIFVILFVVTGGVGVFIIMKKRTNIK